MHSAKSPWVVWGHWGHTVYEDFCIDSWGQQQSSFCSCLCTSPRLIKYILWFHAYKCWTVASIVKCAWLCCQQCSSCANSCVQHNTSAVGQVLMRRTMADLCRGSCCCGSSDCVRCYLHEPPPYKTRRPKWLNDSLSPMLSILGSP